MTDYIAAAAQNFFSFITSASKMGLKIVFNTIKALVLLCLCLILFSFYHLGPPVFVKHCARQAHGAYLQRLKNFWSFLSGLQTVFKTIQDLGDTLKEIGQQLNEIKTHIDQGTAEDPAVATQGVSRAEFLRTIDQITQRSKEEKQALECRLGKEIVSVRQQGETALAEVNQRNRDLESRVSRLELPSFLAMQRALSRFSISSLGVESRTQPNPIIPLRPWPLKKADDPIDDGGDDSEDDDDSDDDDNDDSEDKNISVGALL
ncbi:MAG: hypothetical protein OHK93_003853 [Ramalina farinacea]|uniref:Uncharacterized protein n=1 Tax=Ramalina farinacea TaxID=258253 RepID=A0AA43QHB7_9LECA|nr:hypothetical protein [Ramalina farinacea]